MNYNKTELNKMAQDLHVSRDTFEKVLRLSEILDKFEHNPILKNQFALKGGTAINLMIFPLPRLSTDIDVDLVEPTSGYSKEVLQERKTELRRKIVEVLQDLGYNLEPKSRNSFALDSFLFSYTNSAGNKDRIKLDLNYSLRQHIFPVCKCTSVFKTIPLFSTPMVNPIEIYAAKTVAVTSRTAPRDLYDMNFFIKNAKLPKGSEDLYRKATIFYMAVSSAKTPLNLLLDKIDEITPNMVFKSLSPVLTDKSSFKLDEAKNTVKEFLERTIVPTSEEVLFLEKFSQGKYEPQLLFDSSEIIKRIENHPMAKWKALKNQEFEGHLT